MYIGWIHNINKQAEFKTPFYKVDGAVRGLPSIDDGISTVPQIKNNSLRRRETSEPLRLVCFGSSWFMDTWWYMNKFLQSAGINAELCCFYTGGAYFQQWIDSWDNDSSVNCWTSTNGADWTATTANFKSKLLEGWDVIAFQQGAFQAIDWDGYWANQWSEIVKQMKLSCGIDTVLAFNSTYTPGVAGNLSPYPNTVDGQKQWQQDNYDNVKRFLALSGIDVVSPNGATLWAMRRNATLNNTGNDLASDNLHPDNGLPIYGLCSTFFQTIIGALYGKSVDDVDWLPDESTQKAIVSGSSWMPITTEQRELIRQIVKLAASDRWGFSEL